ncbi:hypothetical protein FB45DRAFT_1002044 [Roridomyces roridus]|uniref:Uncharacterized protein n=1 Tax=Roridomyces roridus TaxID=1738132 RepID=A0AAD7BYP6_9AGAR|nr:hypothetical protein FB45DRAFT_1002044 [Roridomyces roridus]
MSPTPEPDQRYCRSAALACFFPSSISFGQLHKRFQRDGNRREARSAIWTAEGSQYDGLSMDQVHVGHERDRFCTPRSRTFTPNLSWTLHHSIPSTPTNARRASALDFQSFRPKVLRKSPFDPGLGGARVALMLLLVFFKFIPPQAKFNYKALQRYSPPWCTPCKCDQLDSGLDLRVRAMDVEDFFCEQTPIPAVLFDPGSSYMALNFSSDSTSGVQMLRDDRQDNLV